MPQPFSKILCLLLGASCQASKHPMVEPIDHLTEVQKNIAITRAATAELAAELVAMKARMDLLEKGLLLGKLPPPLAQKSLDRPITVEGVPPSPVSNYAEELARGHDAWKQDHIEQALGIFERLTHTPEGSESGQPLYWLGRCLKALKAHERSRLILERYVKSYREEALVIAAHYELADLEATLGQPQLAQRRLTTLLSQPHLTPGLADLVRRRLDLLQEAL
jgi:hypothetical protein